MKNIAGVQYYLNLKTKLKTKDQEVSKKGKFIEWTEDGGLKYKIGTGKEKKISAEIIIAAYHLHNNKNKDKFNINPAWLYLCGHDNRCSVSVLKYIMSKYK